MEASTDFPVTRFAPSPTGELHVGGARTALFAWLYARGRGGRFLLRIEDTDRERSLPAHVERIREALAWLGLDHDGNVVFQSSRHEGGEYACLFAALEAKKIAYRCYCTQEELSARRGAAEAEGGGYRYDGTCRALSPETRARLEAEGKSSVLRLALPRDGETRVHDLLRGDVAFPRTEFDDLVIRKSDGWPTFHFAVVADDAAMGVTHVIRGDDHLTNTPKQVEILAALRAATNDARFAPPAYAHLPLLLGADGKRFSKRHGATSVQAFREKGILPEALFNYLALLGWSPGDDREILTREEIVSLFDLERCGKRAAVFDEEKLAWMNGQYLMALTNEAFLAAAEEYLARAGRPLPRPSAERIAAWGATLEPDAWILRVLSNLKPRVRMLGEIEEAGRFFFRDDFPIDPAAAKKHLAGDGIEERLAALRDAIAACEWTTEAIEREVRAAAERLGVGAGKVMHPARVALTGREASPGFFETVFLLGKTRAKLRLEAWKSASAP